MDLILVICLAGLMLLWFFRTLYLKFTCPYEGRHHLGQVDTVPQTYHPNDSWVPEPVKNRAWWNARMTRQRKVSYLFMPLKDFWERQEKQYRQYLDWLGSGYRWQNIPMNLWPESWKVNTKAICVAGSDLPPRALMPVRQSKPFHITVAARLAA